MKVFYCDTFKGHNPVGVCAIVVAHNKLAARILLKIQLRERGLDLEDKDAICEIDTSGPGALILADGDY